MNSSIDDYITEAVDSGKGWTDSERQEYLDSIDDETHPFFADIDKVDPVMVEAFRQLTYENETNESLAEHFKEEGNARFKRCRLNRIYYKHAALFYTQAIKHAVMAEQSESMVKLRATLLANRAAANLGNKNYGSVKRDCNESLRLQPGNIKCYFRKSKALEGLKDYVEAMKCCQEGLKVDPTSEELKELYVRCKASAEQAEFREVQSADAIQSEIEKFADIYSIAQKRNIQIGPSAFEEGHRHFGSDLFPILDEFTEETLRWPLLLLYPGSQQSDIVREVEEIDVLKDHLSVVFPESGPPPPWDTESYKYRCSNLEVYLKLNAVAPFKNRNEFINSIKKVRALRGEMSAKKFLPEDEKSFNTSDKNANWVHLDLGCSIVDVLRYPDHVLAGGVITLHVYPRNSNFHRKFLADCKVLSFQLQS